MNRKELNYRTGALKRKFKLGAGELETGAFIAKMNESKQTMSKTMPADKKLSVAIMGAV